MNQNPTEWLKQIAIPSPCSAQWESMPGDGRVRSCSECGKEVHNLEAHTPEEVASLIAGPDERPCIRIQRDSAGAIPTKPVDSGERNAKWGMRFRIRALMALIAGVATALGIAKFFVRQSSAPQHVMGEICAVPVPSTPTPPSAPTTPLGRP